MRYGLIIGLLLLLGIGEYAFLELAPLPPERRAAKVERFTRNLPIVKQVKDRDNLRRVKEAFARDDDSVLEIKGSSREISWSSPDELWSAYQRGDHNAGFKVAQLRSEEKARTQLTEVRARAPHGSTWDRIRYYSLSRISYDDADRVEALSLMRADSSATAQWYLAFLFNERRMDPWSVDGLVLSVRRIREDLHYPGITTDEIHRWSQRDRHHVSRIHEAYVNHVPEAVEAVSRLKTEFHIDLTEMLANWNGGHFEHPPSP